MSVRDDSANPTSGHSVRGARVIEFTSLMTSPFPDVSHAPSASVAPYSVKLSGSRTFEHRNRIGSPLCLGGVSKSECSSVPAFINGISLLRSSARTWDGRSIGSVSVGPTKKVLGSSSSLLFGVSWLTHRDPGYQEFATLAVTGYSGRRRLRPGCDCSY